MIMELIYLMSLIGLLCFYSVPFFLAFMIIIKLVKDYILEV